ncbi:hemicentin-1 isoform X2 [Hydra vulgaris]|uniref:Hemicentin-1 isoform X2 n=1 Tax=Hydra vulgaris TaxID=6087 RepID=A0ABM4C6H8_HYDVU
MFFLGLFLLHYYYKGLFGQVTIVDQNVENVLIYSGLGKSVDLTYIIKFEKYGNPERIEVDVRSPSNTIKILFSVEFVHGSYKIIMNNNSDMLIYNERIDPELDQKENQLTVKFKLKNTANSDFEREYRCTVHYPKFNLCYGTILLYEAVSPKISNESFSSTEYVPINTNKKYKCEAIGIPTPKVYWSSEKNSDIKEKQGNGSSTFEINNAQKSDTGEYSCTATNDGGTVVKKMKLFISYIEISESNIFTRHLEKGSEVRERCKIDGCPDLSWIWKNPSQKTISTDQSLLFGDIGNPGKNEFGNYTCIASNIAGQKEYVLILAQTEPTLITASKSVGTGKLIKSSIIIIFGIYFVNLFLTKRFV